MTIAFQQADDASARNNSPVTSRFPFVADFCLLLPRFDLAGGAREIPSNASADSSLSSFSG
jgi:hypothetical protein